MTLKRLEDDSLVFTTALWTRKAREIEANPHVALLFHWPSLGRQVHLTGEATVAERALSEELFAERDPTTSCRPSSRARASESTTSSRCADGSRTWPRYRRPPPPAPKIGAR